MIMQINLSRRNALKLGAAALVSIPVVSIAAQNSGLRASMKYIDKTDKPDQRCDNCAHWVPVADPKALGGCKLFAGDTEINPNGWCIVWAKKA